MAKLENSWWIVGKTPEIIEKYYAMFPENDRDPYPEFVRLVEYGDLWTNGSAYVTIAHFPPLLFVYGLTGKCPKLSELKKFAVILKKTYNPTYVFANRRDLIQVWTLEPFRYKFCTFEQAKKLLESSQNSV